MESKEIIIIIIGIIGSLIATLLFNSALSLDPINLIFFLIGLTIFIILIASYILYKRIQESEKTLALQTTEQKKLKERLKIHEQLIDIKADIKNLQIKNENR